MVLARIRALFSFLLFALLSAGALADPPTRVARLALVNGNASFSPAGERDWGRAIVNRPLTTGDRLWVDRESRAELQIGSVAVRAGGATNLTLLNVDDNVTQIQLTRGTLHLRVRTLDRGQIVEVNTANLAFSIRRPGVYRIEVSPRDDSTTVAVRQGRARVFAEQRAFVVGERQSFAFYGAGLEDYDLLALQPPDELDRWAAARERRWETSASRRYVPVQMIGYEDLDQFGTWRTVAQIGPVWVPRRVAADWAPYRDGHWSWIEPWGWTWIDDAPWGFAPSHYGRWMRLDNTWAWVPGPTNVRPVYAPAVVAFVSGGPAGPASPNVAWFPLGPRDVYRPSYTTSRDYFITLNASARVERQQVITYYSNPPPRVTYVNQQVPGAIVAVSVAAFTQSQPVARQTIRIVDQGFRAAPVLVAPPVVPQPASIMVSVTVNVARPPEAAPARPIVAQVAPPPPRPSFAARQTALAANAGKPLDAAAVAAIKPAEAASAPAVKVVKETEAVEVPKAPAKASSAAAERRARRQRDGDAPAAAAPAAGPASAAPGAAAPASPAASSAAERRRERRQRDGEAPAAAPAAGPASAAPAAAAPAPSASAAERRDRRQRNNDAPAAAPATGPASAPAAAAPAPAETRRPAAPASAAPAATPAPAAASPAPAARPTRPASAAAAPPPDAAGRQRAREAGDAAPRAGRPAPNPAPAAAPAPAPAPAAAAAAAAPAPGASAAEGSEQRGRRPRPSAAATPAASAASAAASAPEAGASEPQRGDRRRARESEGQRRP